MKTHLLRYFVVLAEERHFGRAAQKLSITQPPLSVAIKNLEQELGVALLERGANGFGLTEAGAAFLAEARQILRQIGHAANVAREVAEGKQGVLKIGVTGSMVYRDLRDILSEFTRRSPKVGITLHEMSTTEQQHALLHGQLHGGFINARSVMQGLSLCSLPANPLVCCVPLGHRLAGAPRVDLQDLRQETFVMFSRDVSPANYDNVIACLQKAGIHPRTQHAARQWLTVIALVSIGQGISLVPACMRQPGLAGVRFIPLKPIRGLKADSPAGFAWNPAFAPPALRALKALVDLRDAPRA